MIPATLLRRPSTWIGLIFSVISIPIVLAGVNLPDLLAKLAQADGRFILLGIVIIGLIPFVRALRWQVVLRAKTPFWAVFHAENVGYLINNVLPLRMGEPARAMMLSRSTSIPAAEALSTVVLSRIADMIAIVGLLGLAIPALSISASVRAAGYATLLIAFVLIVGVIVCVLAQQQVLLLLTRIGHRVLPHGLADRLLGWTAEFLNGLQSLREGRRLIGLMFTTALLWFFYFLYYQMILWAFAPGAPLAWANLATCTASLSTAIPSSPAYIGVYHAVVAFTLTPYIGQDAALGYAIALHAIEFIGTLLFGLISLTISGTSLGKVTLGAAALSESAPS